VSARPGIGRGLAAILPQEGPGEPSYRDIPLDLIRSNPEQPRRRFDPESIAGLAASITEAGVIQPLIVRPLADGRYELIAGERRWRAAREAGLETIPALVRDEDAAQRMQTALIENVAREDLNPVDEARACAALVEELGLSKEELAARLGRTRPAISNLIRILELPDEVLELLAGGELSEGHGRAILQLRDRNEQRALARRARDEGLTVRKTEALARGADAPGTGGRRRPALVAADALEACRELEDSLSRLLGHDVRVRMKGRGAKVEIAFEDLREAQELLRILSGRAAA